MKSIRFSLLMFCFYCTPVWADEVQQSTILVAEQTQENIVVDGVDDEAVWKKSKRLTVYVQDGGIGDIEVSLQSAYNRESVYFLARWPDSTESLLKESWIYQEGSRQWMRKLKDRKLHGKWIKPKEKIEDEDRLAIIWNIDNSIMGFNVIGCQVLCHGDRIHTNRPDERADIWHWKSVRTNPLGYIDDKWLSNKSVVGWEYEDVEAGRHGDFLDQTAGLKGLGGNYADNIQTITAQGKTLEVPLYWEPDAVGEDRLFITQEEIVNSEAVKIIDPGKLDISRIIPGFILFRPAGSRGDISAQAVWKDGFWNLEFKRKLVTAHSDDVQFDVTKNYRFGLAIMDNSGGFRAFRRGHSYSIRAYTLQFGGVASQITNHLLLIKDYITMSAGYVKKENPALALSELSYAQGILDEVAGKLAEADPERFLKFKRSLLQTRLQLNEKNLNGLNYNIDEFIYLIQGKVEPTPPSWLAVFTMGWVKIQSYVFLILGLLAFWLLISLVGILREKAWKRMGIFLFVVIVPVFFEGIGRFGILTGIPLLNNLSFTTNEYARLIFALTTAFALLYSRLGFHDLYQAKNELEKEISVRERAEESLQEAHDGLEIKVDERTADLAKANKELQMEINEHEQTEGKLKKTSEELRNLSTHLQLVREEERTTIAQEIHDELGQLLTCLQIDLSRLVKVLPKNTKPLSEKINGMSKLIDTSIETVQRISSELRPNVLDYLGIIPAMECHAEGFQNHTGITCIITYNTEDIALDKDRSTAIFRVFQETLTNVARHANATQIKANLTRKKEKLILTISDNGKGISKEEIFSPKSFGLIGINERANFIGGEAKITGAKGKGTTIKITIPIS